MGGKKYVAGSLLSEYWARSLVGDVSMVTDFPTEAAIVVRELVEAALGFATLTFSVLPPLVLLIPAGLPPLSR